MIIPNENFIKFNFFNFKKEYFDDELIFEYIDKKEKLLLPMFYKVLIEKNPSYSNHQFIFNLYSNVNDNLLKNLIKSIITIQDIPIPLLSKYYARIYTYDSEFYNNLNKDLRNNKEIEMSYYLPYIKTLYLGVDLQSLPLTSNKIKLYRGTVVSTEEIEEIQSHKTKLDDLPTYIVYSRVFLSFSKDKDKAYEFLKNCNLKKNLCKVLFVVKGHSNKIV